jgi:hypothetical protein
MNCSAGNRPKVEASARRALEASRAALTRMKDLAAMNERQRQAAWDGGPEVEWFGRYKRSKKVPFAFVFRTIKRINSILEGKPTHKMQPCQNRISQLTIDCFEPGAGSPSIRRCGQLELKAFEDPGCDPQRAWVMATGANRFKTENHKLEAELLACRLKKGGDLYGYSNTIMNNAYLNPMERKREPGPYKIALVGAWFRRPSRLDPKEWREMREVTIVHEVAHLAGAIRSLDEIGGKKRSLRLARRNPWGARVNAENYGFYARAVRMR